MNPVCLVTEYCHNGNLFDLLHETVDDKRGEHYAVQIPWQRRIRIALDVARGMNFLHTSTPVIIHRDLKSLNILINEKWTAKVSDFGLSRFKVGNASGLRIGGGYGARLNDGAVRNVSMDGSGGDGWA